jgi:hypothetical protein
MESMCISFSVRRLILSFHHQLRGSINAMLCTLSLRNHPKVTLILILNKVIRIMKRITILSVMMLLSAISFAQTNSRVDNSTCFQSSYFTHNGVKPTLKVMNTTAGNGVRAMMNTINKETIIDSQPEGKLIDKLYRMGTGGYLMWGFNMSRTYDGLYGRIVEDAQGNIYIDKMFSEYPYTGWVKAEKGVGDTVIVKCPQTVCQVDGAYFYVNSMVQQMMEDSTKTFVVNEKNNEVKFVWKDGVLTQYGETMLGITDNQGGWTGYSEKQMVFKPQTDKMITPNIGSATLEDYVIMSHPNDSTTSGRVVKVAINGDHVYMKGLSDNLMESWIEGTKTADKVVFNSNQYLGTGENNDYHFYFKTGAVAKVYIPYFDMYMDSIYFNNKIELDYNATNRTMKSDSAIFINAGKDNLYHKEYFNQPDIRPYKEVAATPKDPKIISFYPFSEEKGTGFIKFNAYSLDVDGNFIDPAKVYYSLYLDDKQLLFKPENYESLKEATTDIPYTMDDEWNFYVYGDTHRVYFYTGDFTKMGVQVIYKGGGETRKSNIVYLVVDGIQNVSASDSGNVKGISYFDLSGRKIANPVRGLYFKATVYDNGTTTNEKVLMR